MKTALIHLSDIHYVSNQDEGVSAIISSLLNDLKKQMERLKDYEFYLIISGDIVNEGSNQEFYASLSSELDDSLNKLSLTKNKRIIVPGNHDINRDLIENDFQNHQAKINDNSESEQKFNDFLGNNYFTNYFTNYLDFEDNFADFGCKNNVAGHGFSINSDLNIFCLNSALCAFGGLNKIDDSKKLSIDTRNLVKWCKENDSKNNILIMHHPLNELKNWSKEELQQIIENNFFLCLNGHVHNQSVLYNNISKNCINFTSPQLWTQKTDKLGYSIILIDGNITEKVIYRQHIKGKFSLGNYFSENEYGFIDFEQPYSYIKEQKNLEILEHKLNNALSHYKNQPTFFVKRKLSTSRKFNEEVNLLDELIVNPFDSVVYAQPQFGLTSLSHYMRLKAFKINDFWVYLDIEHVKLRKLQQTIEEQILNFDKEISDIKCIILDSWNSQELTHCNSLKLITDKFQDVPVIIMSGYTGIKYNDFDFSQINRHFKTLHLQSLQQTDIRSLVTNYNEKKYIAEEDQVVKKVVDDLKTINAQRTPINCFTILRILDHNFNESIINRTKMLKTALFILFTDSDSFTYASIKPDMEDVEYLVGKFCEKLIKKRINYFELSEFKTKVSEYSDQNFLSIDIELIIDIFLSNHIIIKYGNRYEFRHCYWIYYFAACYMYKDVDFKDYVLKKENYIDFPEVIDFYTSIDGQRVDAVEVLQKDTNELSHNVNEKIGIANSFNPYNSILWNPSDDCIERISKEISEKVITSSLPKAIKDQHADKNYDSEKPYNQSINKFLSEYNVISLIQSIKATSRALRNSKFINSDLKINMLNSILVGWEQIFRVILWVAHILALEGRAEFGGWGLRLEDSFKGTPNDKLKEIILAIPMNIINFLKDDISSKKIGKLFYFILNKKESELICHFASLFLIQEKPAEWYKPVFEYMNLLHQNSFYLGDLDRAIAHELTYGFNSDEDKSNLKNLRSLIVAKHKYAAKHKKKIPENMIVNIKNRIEVDKALSSSKKRSGFLEKKLR